MKQVTRIKILIVLIVLSISGKVFTQDSCEINYQFMKTDSGYTFIGKFNTKANPNCILDLCFQLEHLRALAPDAKNIVLINQGTNWNQIKYTYKKFLYFENKSIWDRTLDKENLRLDFKLIFSQNNTTLMPEMIASKGHYRVYKQGNNFFVEYYQECTLSESSLTNIYINKVRKEAIEFLNRFKEYSISVCNSSN